MKSSPILSPELKKLKPIIVRILKRNGAVRAGVFGSYARGQHTKKSDVDILVKINRKMSLFDFVGIQQELEDSLKKKVDLVEYGALKPLLRSKVLKEEVKVL